MGVKSSSFKRKLLATSISSCLLASAGAVTAQEIAEEVIVLGVRGAQESSINLKRDASSIVDGIAAEDIGKLPDVTISDSLQRISGIQIRRSAGEGGSVNIRGLPQVVTQLNGEQYLGANSITSVQPNFGDIPSQLFKGADVHKTAQAKLAYTGITGTIDLRTYRPFDFDEGPSGAAGFELQTGTETGSVDPVVSGLFNWRNDRVGFLLAGAYANVNLSNSYNGFNTTEPDGGAGWVEPSNGWGAAYDYNHASPQGIGTWYQETERERLGINASFQADLGEGFEVVADVFYTKQDEYNRKQGIEISNRWQGLGWITPVESRETGDFGGPDGLQGHNEWRSVQVYDFDVYRTATYGQNDAFFSDSTNVSLALNYDNGGPLTLSSRALFARAEQDYRHGYTQADLTDWGPNNTMSVNPFYPAAVAEGFSEDRIASPELVGEEGGRYIIPNPMGYSENPSLRYDTRGKHPTWSGFHEGIIPGGINDGAGGTLAEYMANQDSYSIGAYTSENNYNRTADLTVFRVDGSYQFERDMFVTSVDAGVRYGSRSVSNDLWHLFSNFYGEMDGQPHQGGGARTQIGSIGDDGVVANTDGCPVQWKAIDVVLNNPGLGCVAGEYVLDADGNRLTATDDDGNEFEVWQGYTALVPQGIDAEHNVVYVTDLGPIDMPPMYVPDPRDYDDSEAFHERVYGNAIRNIVPGRTYAVDMAETTFYAQANFARGIMSGNFGLRVVETELTVQRKATGEDRPYGNTAVDLGDTVDRRTYTDILPALNVAFNLTDDITLRTAYSRNMVPLDLNQWGDGLSISYSIAPELGEGVFRVNDASQDGNPNLDPWRADNFDLSLEWYFGPASMANIALFHIEVESFTQDDTIEMSLPDTDGVIRGTVFASSQVQGDGGSLTGLEMGTKIAFGDFMDGFIGDFGIDTNYTYAPSTQGERDISGNRRPFPDNSEHQANFIAWYQADRLQARIAYNYRSERLAATGQAGGNLDLYQKATSYVDASISYDVTDDWTVYLNASNITGEFEEYYLQWEDQYAFQQYFEPRYTLGVRARF